MVVSSSHFYISFDFAVDDYNRVVLKSIGGSDYINASFMDVSCYYIARNYDSTANA